MGSLQAVLQRQSMAELSKMMPDGGANVNPGDPLPAVQLNTFVGDSPRFHTVTVLPLVVLSWRGAGREIQGVLEGAIREEVARVEGSDYMFDALVTGANMMGEEEGDDGGESMEFTNWSRLGLYRTEVGRLVEDLELMEYVDPNAICCRRLHACIMHGFSRCNNMNEQGHKQLWGQRLHVL